MPEWSVTPVYDEGEDYDEEYGSPETVEAPTIEDACKIALDNARKKGHTVWYYVPTADVPDGF
jgi:hypothetical protein